MTEPRSDILSGRAWIAASVSIIAAGAADAWGQGVTGRLDEPASKLAQSAADVEQRAFDYLHGESAAPDIDEALRLFGLAAAEGRALSQLMLAMLLRDSQADPRDGARSLEYYHLAAEQGLAAAQSYLAFAYGSGTGVRRDFSVSLEWLIAAARQEDPASMFFLATMLRSGDGVERDVELAERLVARAAELRFPPATSAQARVLLYERDGAADHARGIHLMREAAQADDAAAAYFLGYEHLRGLYIPQDPAAALQWLSRAADAGYGLAALWLAELYDKGLGTERDEDQARRLRQEALASAPVGVRNAFAWALSVHEVDVLRHGPRAVEIMEQVVAHLEDRTAWALDTLAAAYAETGDFEQAIKTQREALDAAPPGFPEVLQSRFELRLELYRAGKPYRENP